jgi:glycosyltransferase involved in cell wall biosynthesis
MKVLFVHQRIGDWGGAESTIRRLAEGLTTRGVALGLLYGEQTGRNHGRFHELFPKQWCWSEGELPGALDWGADTLFVHKVDELSVLENLIDTGPKLVRMVHDHDIYCQRRHRYLPWNRRICTRRAGWSCGIYCGILRGDGKIPLRVGWPGDKLREIELCKKFHHFITVSDYLKQELLLHDFPEERITTLWPAVREPDPSYQATYREPLVVFAGQVLRGKGVDVLIEALSLLRTPGWRCSIVGDGTFLPRCQSLVRDMKLQDRVALTGWVPQQELHGILGHARAGVVPSVWPEPLGAVGIEMFRHGLPVVAFDVGGIREWLDDGLNGYLVPVFDRQALAQRLDLLLGNPEHARSLGELARRQAAQWCHAEEHFDRVLTLLRGDHHAPEHVSLSLRVQPA